MKNKRIIIIHGWDGNSKGDWFPWVKKELENRDYQVLIPDMPNAGEPKIKEWVNHIIKIVQEPDENTFFVGRSIGCQAILRYLETLGNKKVGGVVLVAPWFKTLTNLEPEEEKVAEPWLETPIDFGKIRGTTDKFTAIFSDNDEFVVLEENRKIFEEELGGKTIIERNKGHFDEDSGIFEIPVLLNVLLDYLG